MTFHVDFKYRSLATLCFCPFVTMPVYNCPFGTTLAWLFYDCSNCGSSFSVPLGKSMGLSVGEATRSASHWISLASMSSVVSVSHCFYVWGPLLCLCVFKTVKASNREHSRSIYVCTVFIPFVLLEPPLRQLSTSCSIQVCRTTAHLSAWLHSCVYVCACKDGRWGFHRRLGLY